MPSSPVPKVPGAPAAPCAPRHTRLRPSLTEAACSHCVPGVLDLEETAEIVQHEGEKGGLWKSSCSIIRCTPLSPVPL